MNNKPFSLLTPFVVIVTVLLIAGGALLTLAAQPVAAAEVLFRRPTDALVLDPFRLPDGKYGPGNRGIEYDTNEFDRIVAATRGTVIFAGAVAGNLFVTLDHGSGLVSSYGFVGHIMVREGEEVVGGELVALAKGPFHFTVRLNGEYIDPEPLFGTRRIVVRLVPHPVQGRRGLIGSSLRSGLWERAATLPRDQIGLRRHQVVADEQAFTRVGPGRFGARHGH